MRLNKDDIYSLIGTVAFHGVILLILWFTVLKTEVPDEDGGVLVNFGNVDAAAGMFEPKYTCLLYTSPSPRDRSLSRMPSSA